MIGAISGLSAYYRAYPYSAAGASPQSRTAQAQGAQGTEGVWTARKPSNLESPVEPVRPVTAVTPDKSEPAGLGLPIRLGVDPVEMAVRMRIQYVDPTSAAGDEGAAQGVEGVQKAAEAGKCQTCEKRKYQDGSDDMGVSFQTPTRVDPDMAASAVRGHEMEHVVREQAKAQREDRRVVSQSVTLHTDICPECGKVYISGGTTRTTTAANPEPQPAAQQEQAQERRPFSAVA